MKDKYIGLLSIGSMITLLEALAIFKGIDGQMFATVIAALVGIFGYIIGIERKM